MEDIKNCPYCNGEVKIIEFGDFSGHLECKECHEILEFYRHGRNGRQRAIERFNKYLGR